MGFSQLLNEVSFSSGGNVTIRQDLASKENERMTSHGDIRIELENRKDKLGQNDWLKQEINGNTSSH